MQILGSFAVPGIVQSVTLEKSTNLYWRLHCVGPLRSLKGIIVTLKSYNISFILWMILSISCSFVSVIESLLSPKLCRVMYLACIFCGTNFKTLKLSSFPSDCAIHKFTKSSSIVRPYYSIDFGFCFPLYR